MRQAVVTFASDVLAEWGFGVFRDASIRDTEILSCDGASGVVRIRVEDPFDEQRLDDEAAIQWWELVSRDESEAVYLVEACTAETGATTGVDAEGRLRAEQVEVTPRGFAITYAGPQDRLSEELSALEAAGIDVSLDKLQSYRARGEPVDALTDRQREVLEVALDRGYYDLPRDATAKDLGDELDLDDSTVSEHLRRAERNLVSAVLGRPR